MKKILLFLFAAVFGNNAMAQIKPSRSKLESVDSQIKKIEALVFLDLNARESFSASATRLNVPINIDAGVRLKKSVELTIYFSEELEKNSMKLNENAQINSHLKNYINIVINQVLPLQTFDDFWDSSNRTTLKYNEAKLTLSGKMRTEFNELISLIAKTKTRLENELHQSLGSNPEGVFSLVQKQFNQYDLAYQVQVSSFNLYIGAMNWVYTPLDTASINLTLKNLKQTSPKLHAQLLTTEDDQLKSVIEPFLRLRTGVAEITQELKTVEDHEDATTLLLSQDRLEQEIYTDYCSLTSALNENLKRQEREIKNLLSGDFDEKKEDIRKMLTNNYKSMEWYFENTNPKLDLNTLIDKLVPIYYKRFTYDEIKEIIQFQESATGTKLRESTGEILIETVKALKK